MNTFARQAAAVGKFSSILLSPLIPIPFAEEITRLFRFAIDLIRRRDLIAEHEADRALEGRLFSTYKPSDTSDQRQSVTTLPP